MKMSTNRTMVAAILLLGFGLAASEAVAKDAANRQSGDERSRAGTARAKGLSGRELIGQAVRNREGEPLGKIRELLIDPADGKVTYAIVASGGVLGINEADRAVPFAVLTAPMAGADGLTLDLPRTTWESAPTLPANRLDLLNDEAGARDTVAFFRQHAKADFSPARARQIRATEIIGRDVMSQGRNVGEVQDVLVHLESQRAKVVLEPNAEFTGAAGEFLVGLDQLQSFGQERLQTKLTQSDFANKETSRDWWKESDGRPIAWSGLGTRAPIYTNDAPTVRTTPKPTSPSVAETTTPAAGRPTVTLVRGRLRTDTDLPEDARLVTIEENGNRLILVGTVTSEAVKKELDRKVRSFADGWTIDNRVMVRGASE